jgi:syntaxin 8
MGRELDTMDEDEEAMKLANSQVLQMQHRMMQDQDEQLDSLSSAISRQHALSLRVAEELELHSNLLDDTEAAVDRTDQNLRRASGRLDQFARKAKNTGSTGLIVALIIVLVILIIVFKF